MLIIDLEDISEVRHDVQLTFAAPHAFYTA